MRQTTRLRLLTMFGLLLLLAGCGGDGGGGSTKSLSTVNGSAVKSAIEGAEIKIFYFDSTGAEVEIHADNAPVLTDPTGTYAFNIDTANLTGIITPLIIRTAGGTMGNPPAEAPILEAVIADPALLSLANSTTTSHLSTASSVAAGLLNDYVKLTGVAPTTLDARKFIARVEDQLAVNLETNPADSTQGVAVVNNYVDQVLDLINTPANNPAVNEYIQYLVANLSSASEVLDETMQDPNNTGADIPVSFEPIGDGLLIMLYPEGPSSLQTLLDSDCDGDCFPNGVAAGDVDQSSVVLWARASFTGTVRFEYGRDEDYFRPPDNFVDVKVVTATKDDGTIDYIPSKVPITGLLPGTQYHYRVCRGTCEVGLGLETAVHGRFRTPFADGYHGLKFGVSSCWRGDMKPFVSIKNVPEKKLDFFVALGDTVYADGAESGGQAIDLAEFREKHDLAYRKLDPPHENLFARARASTAFYVNIDDHEVVDNFAGGAHPSTHDDSLTCRGIASIDNVFLQKRCLSICDTNNRASPYDPEKENSCDRPFTNETDLFLNGVQAWHEYNPVSDDEIYVDTGDSRTAGKQKLYRYRTFGKDAALIMLDTRSFRDEPPSTFDAYDDTKTMLGKAQLNDLKSDLVKADNSGITWKIVLVPEPIQKLGIFGAEDRFEGYARERGEILSWIETKGINNVVFISGDIHGTVVNNLTYKRSLQDPQRFSASWDISTGPVAYAEPLGRKLTNPGSGVGYRYFDSQVALLLNEILFLGNDPLTGLGPEVFVGIDPLQQYNRSVPATLEVPSVDQPGSYVNAHTYGWTEFEIHPTTHALTVTTYGIDWYQKPEQPVDESQPDGPKAYTPAELEEIRARPQFIVSKFEVLPHPPPKENRSFCNGNGDCQSKLCNLNFCMSPQPNGNACEGDDACIGGLCNLAICMSPQPNGNACGGDDACISGLCDLGICTALNSRPALSPCFSGDACKNGSCTLGTCEQICGDSFCDGTEKCGGNDVTGLQCRSDCGQCTNGSACGDDNMCKSGLCNAGTCTFPQENGQPCVKDEGCVSENCELLQVPPTCRPKCRAAGVGCILGGECCSGKCSVLKLECQ